MAPCLSHIWRRLVIRVIYVNVRHQSILASSATSFSNSFVSFPSEPVSFILIVYLIAINAFFPEGWIWFCKTNQNSLRIFSLIRTTIYIWIHGNKGLWYWLSPLVCQEISSCEQSRTFLKIPVINEQVYCYSSILKISMLVTVQHRIWAGFSQTSRILRGLQLLSLVFLQSSANNTAFWLLVL